MKSKKYFIEIPKLRCSEEEFDNEVSRNLDILEDCIPETDPEYSEKLLKSAISCAISVLDPESAYNEVSSGFCSPYIDSSC